MKIEKRYLNGEYLKHNPDWDMGDAAWKASEVIKIATENKIKFSNVCEVGCGSGEILRQLKRVFSDINLTGYDVSPQLEHFWKNDSNLINFQLGDFILLNNNHYDTLLLLDVFEHVRDPYTFLENLKSHSDHFIFHIPLDLSSTVVARKNPLLESRKKVGHLHFYTKELAIETLMDCGYEIIEAKYTNASFTMPNRSLKTRLANVLRLLFNLFNKDLSARVFGGQTLIVLAK